MSSRIPQAFINELIGRADILELVGARVALKKAGSSYKGLCPFHDEKTPSFSVSPDKGFYHCFGCHAGGNAIDFLMEHDHMTFPEAVDDLAAMLGIEVPVDRDYEDRGETQGLLEALVQADRIYRRALRDSPAAQDYLKRRGIDGAAAQRFAIGYAPDAWDTVFGALGRGEAQARLLLQSGLAVKSDKGHQYDRFRDRIMFPIRDRRGKVIGFGGRMLGDGEPKYLNSPETPLFHKGRALYGVYEARQRPGHRDEIIVVEGYLDVVCLAQHGIEPVVATLGTATSTDHVRQLTRLYKRVVFCFDGDRAGRAAAWRALETALPYAGSEVELSFLLLPDGEDPDSLVRSRGADAFRDLLQRATPLSNFLLDELREQVDLGSADGRSKIVALARPLLERLPRGVYRDLLTADLARVVGLKAERLGALLDSPLQRPVTPDTGTVQLKSTLIRKTITLALHFPSVAGSVSDVEGFEDVDQPGASLLRQVLEAARDNPEITPAHLVERFRDDPEGRYLHRLAADVPLDDEQAAPAVLRDSLERLVREQQHRNTVRALKNHALGGRSD